MNFKKTAIALSLTLACASAQAQNDSYDLPEAFNTTGKAMTVEDLDRLEQAKIRLQTMRSYKELQAEVTALEYKIQNPGGSDESGPDAEAVAELEEKLEILSDQNATLSQALQGLTERLNYYQDSNNPEVMEHHVFVTRTYTVKGVKKAKIFYNNYFDTLTEGDEIALGVIVDAIDNAGIVIRKPGGDTHRILKTTHERAVIETFGIHSKSDDDALVSDDDYVVPSL